MFKKKLEFIFIGVILLSLSVVFYNVYNTYTFKYNNISDSFTQRIINKEEEVLNNMQKNFGFIMKVPIIVTDEFKGKLYGLTSYRNGEINIYLNKKVMQESMDYIVDSVIAHEYAHALMFKLGHFNEKDKGHSKQWQRACIKLGGKDCQQYVNQKEIIMSKMPF